MYLYIHIYIHKHIYIDIYIHMYTFLIYVLYVHMHVIEMTYTCHRDACNRERERMRETHKTGGKGVHVCQRVGRKSKCAHTCTRPGHQVFVSMARVCRSREMGGREIGGRERGGRGAGGKGYQCCRG